MMRLFLLSVAALVVLSAGNARADETTTQAPPTPLPYRNKWAVSNSATEPPCILFEANVTVAVKYAKANSTRSDFVNVVVPQDAGVDESVSDPCNFPETNLTNAQLLRVLFYPDGNASRTQWALSFYFTNDKNMSGGKAFGLYKVKLEAVYDDYARFPDAVVANETFVSARTTTFSGVVAASVNHSSQCSSGDLHINDNANVHLDSFRVQAYGDASEFLMPELCDHDVRTSDIVPIVVGACLAALVIIVLVAYLIGRARAKRQGYASV